MGTTLSLIFRPLATKFSNLVQKKNPLGQGGIVAGWPKPWDLVAYSPAIDAGAGLPVSWKYTHPVNMGIPGFPFLCDFGDPVVIIGTPFSDTGDEYDSGGYSQSFR